MTYYDVDRLRATAMGHEVLQSLATTNLREAEAVMRAWSESLGDGEAIRLVDGRTGQLIQAVG